MSGAVTLFLERYSGIVNNGGVGAIFAVAMTVSFVLALSFLFGCIVLFAYKKWQRSWIRKNSQRYVCMRELCSRYQFEKVPMAASSFQCCSKAEYDRFDFQKRFEDVVEYHIGAFKERLGSVERNQFKLFSFQQEYAQLPNSTYKRKGWIKEEATLCEALYPKPSCSFRLYIRVVYVSPKGRNSYEKEKTYIGEDILSSWDSIQKRRAEERTRQEQIKRERAKVTPGLRYEIMQRDGFRCQICGSEQSDGVKLHVDHIVPVSKGGKTTRENLQTLCDRCNLGKSDRL